MHLKAQTGTELEMMKGIVATLLALAGLADLASHAPHPVRSFVLWLLRRVEAVAREWVDRPADVGPVAVRVGNGPADALDLAASLRALACAVEGMAAQYQQFTRLRRHDDPGEAGGAQRRAPDGFHRAGISRRLSSLAGLAAAPCPDTS